MYLIILVIDNPYFCGDVLLAWHQAGVPGATILESHGLGRALTGARDDLPLLPSLDDLVQRDEQRHRTVFAVVPDRDIIARVKQATENVIGRFDDPNTGILFVVPVLEAYGVRK